MTLLGWQLRVRAEMGIGSLVLSRGTEDLQGLPEPGQRDKITVGPGGAKPAPLAVKIRG